jgi:rare lipoprotein A
MMMRVRTFVLGLGREPGRRSGSGRGGGVATALLAASLLVACSSSPDPSARPAGPVVRAGDAELPVSEAGETGVASWYGVPYHGRTTASGETYDMNDLTAAHPSLPFGARVRVTNLGNGRSLVLRINDRGPFVERRIIDVSKRAAKELGFLRDGLARVRVEVL